MSFVQSSAQLLGAIAMIVRSMVDAMKRAGRVHTLELAAGPESELTCMNIMCERVGSPCACRLALC